MSTLQCLLIFTEFFFGGDHLILPPYNLCIVILFMFLILRELQEEQKHIKLIFLLKATFLNGYRVSHLKISKANIFYLQCFLVGCKRAQGGFLTSPVLCVLFSYKNCGSYSLISTALIDNLRSFVLACQKTAAKKFKKKWLGL